ncbi:sulfotransferase family protein [Algicella marina]|uniref:Sulfotransferase n=1 Tax=Algicella marina TaxID=2683284 RepID=A0A6P1T323_9RHOB|nr:sulfotransferase [Algicella marina]QHQ36417.1 sulfotransferase [Algicella marina]
MSRRILPDFIVIGAMKAGTTTLYELLRRHPEIGMSREKETDFFVENKGWRHGPDWYHRQFAPGFRVYGEASPNYTKAAAFPGVAARMAAVVPEVKLIFIARDPVARALSQYRHAALIGGPVPPPEALEGSSAWEHMIETSSYAAQLEPYLAEFPSVRLLVLDFGELCSDTETCLGRVAAHLGVADRWGTADVENGTASLARLPDWLLALRRSRARTALKRVVPPGARRRLKAALASGGARAVPDVPPALRARLAALLAADAARFRLLTGQRFADWEV